MPRPDRRVIALLGLHSARGLGSILTLDLIHLAAVSDCFGYWGSAARRYYCTIYCMVWSIVLPFYLDAEGIYSVEIDTHRNLGS
jgi:hypothetical protein